MDDKTLKIYKTVFNNSILFLNRGIDEITNSRQELTREQFVVSCLFIQTSLELGLKAFLVKENGVKAILKNGHQNQTIENIFDSFENNDLRTKTYNDLKKILSENEITSFGEIHYEHLTRFQKFRNNLVHLNLNFSSTDLQNLKYESVFAIVHLIIPLLSDIDLENETPSEFYEEYLDDHQYKKLISFPQYIEEMEKVAKKFTGYAYECPECYAKTFSPGIGICYCCNLNFIEAAEYINCKICNAENAVIFDSLNIELNDNMISGLCLNCGDKPNIFKCPHCDCKQTFYGKDELKNSCFVGCKNI